LRAAQPLPLPKKTGSDDGGVDTGAAATTAETRKSIERAGRKPATDEPPPSAGILFEVPPNTVGGQAGADSSAIAPQAKGSSGAPFSTRRVEPQAAVEAYPHRAAGKLFFTDAQGRASICSGAVIAPRLIATAGHCVFDTVVNRFHTNFLFVPAYRRVGTAVTARYGQWNWSTVYTTTSWVNGNGSFPNAGDFAILVARDQAGRKIGTSTGWLGWRTGGLAGNHVHVLGYPGNLDNGLLMQENTAHIYALAAPNAAQIGSDMRGGSSGGAWVENFGIHGVGDPTSTGVGNKIVGIVSYGPVAIGPRYQGSSILNAEWVNLYNTACRQAAGNC
jgi:V8-like Glu-specific endopeptidase